MHFIKTQFSLNVSTIAQPGLLGQSDALSDWYSGGCVFDPWSGHIFFIEI